MTKTFDTFISNLLTLNMGTRSATVCSNILFNHVSNVDLTYWYSFLHESCAQTFYETDIHGHC